MAKTDLPKNAATTAALFEAQRLAFAPIAFQVARVLRETGVLTALAEARRGGTGLADLKAATGLSRYALRVLLEGGSAAGLVWQKGERYAISKTGFFVLHDEMTRVNMDFVHDVCFQGSFFLDEAVRTGRPAGLKVFGPWPTIYEGLSKLPEPVKKSWFAFDHYYSDSAFPDALTRVFATKPQRLFDIGGNTGKWALACVGHDPDVAVTILDLPGQLRVALEAAATCGAASRITGHAIDLLDPAVPIPPGADAIWMSQFLCCFSEEQIVSILTRVARAMTASTRVWILDTFWDRQKHDLAKYCLQMSSLYFTVMANGTSRMYHSDDLKACLDEAGLEIVQATDGLGMSHTLFECRRRGASG